MSVEQDFARLMRFVERELSSLRAENEELRRRQANFFREGSVTQLHEDDGVVELDADGLPSDKLPWLARAGKQREWDPPTVGERVVLIGVTGEPGVGLVLPGGFSNKFPQNHNKAGEHRRSVGDKVHTTTTESLKRTETEKVTRTQFADYDVVRAGESKFATYDGKNVSDAAKTLVRNKLRVACGDADAGTA